MIPASAYLYLAVGFGILTVVLLVSLTAMYAIATAWRAIHRR